MFGWFKKKEDPKTAAAYEKGRELGAEMGEAVENWFTQGLEPYRQLVLKDLRTSLEGYEHVQNMPPGYFVRSALADCYEILTERQELVKSKTYEFLKDWLEVSDIMEMRADFEKLIEKRLGDFDAALRIEALSTMTESVPNLVNADQNWRQRYPELARQYPKPDDPNFKSDGRNALPFR